MRPDPDPTVEEIERAIQKARFEEGETDRFLSRRHAAKAREAASRLYRDKERRGAFMAGYKHAQDGSELKFAAMAIGAILLIAAVWQLIG